MSDRLSLEDIAKKAGVSRSTVSRVVNNEPNVNHKTREHVKKVIAQEGFTPNPSARALVTQRTRIIGLVIPLTPNVVFFDEAMYFPTLLQGVADAAAQREYALLIWLGQPDEDEDHFYGRVVNNRLMDGLILASTPSDNSLVNRLLEMNKTFVQIERPVSNQDRISYVTVDNVHAAQAAVDHLINQGRRRIGTITGSFVIPDAVDRFEGYKQALRLAGLPIDENLIYRGQFSRRAGYLGMKTLLEQGVDAVFASTDSIAVGVIEALRDHHVRVPDEVAVVGFDDLPFAAGLKPQLTTVRQPTTQKGARATELLIDLIEEVVEGPQQILLPTQLVIRESCGALVHSMK